MKTNKKEILIVWRERNHLTQGQVEELLDYPPGTLNIFETRGFANIPTRELIKIVFLYKVPIEEFLRTVRLVKRDF